MAPSVVMTSLWPSRGHYLYLPSPCCNGCSYSTTPFYGRLLAGYFSLLGPDSFPHPRSLCLLQIFLFSPPLASISTVVFFLSFSFIYYLPISSLLLSSPFFVSCYFISVPFLPFLYHSNSSPPIPLHLGLVQTLQPPLSIFVLLNCSPLSSPSSFSFPLSFSAHHYVPFVSRFCMWYFYHGVALDYDFYPLLLLCSFSSIYYHMLC